MQEKVTKQELDNRLKSFLEAMNREIPDWDTALFLGKVNQYYFTGTMQDGMLMIKKDGSAYYFVRRSYERALDESPFSNIHPMESYGDAAEVAGKECGNTYLEAETVTIGILERLKRKFDISKTGSLDRTVLSLRAVKSPYEIHWMEEAGRLHNKFLTNVAPELMREGVSEADFAAELFAKMVNTGHQGYCRFSMFQNELVVGQIGFGESSLYPTSFDGPGGSTGVCPAAPFLGSRERKLRKGDLVFIDIGYAVNGYNSDKTQVYMFGAKPSEEAVRAHRECIDVQSRIAEMMKPGVNPADIYNTVMDSLSDDFKQNFMGFGSRQVKFLGHGVGLHVDELPLIAGGYKTPLKKNMAVALEPKKGIAGVGMVGPEDTYIVEEDGARCITGGGRDIIVVE
jgi:Xaa-Pro dipeptidase